MSGEGGGSVGYRAAQEGAGVLLREGFGFMEVIGAAPGDMLKGILSGSIPQPLVPEGDVLGKGRYAYSTILTPKGKMVTDLHLLPSPSGGFLMVLPSPGMEGARGHFKKYLHPKFAQLRERSSDLSYLSLIGPGARELLAALVGMEGENLPDSGEIHTHLSSAFQGLSVLGSGELGVPAFHLVLPGEKAEAIVKQALEQGGEALEPDDLNTIRVEAGRPLFGVDMTTDTIPVEAGIHEEAIDYQKGCYTGQEVIIRLRDRGKVNKRLCKVLLGDTPPPPTGTELFYGDAGKGAGWITSSCTSPRLGQTIALGFIKRGVEVGGTVMLGGPQGPMGEVSRL
jgi:folate-binding protein YgfZ